MSELTHTCVESLEVGASPVVHHFLRRLRLLSFFEQYLPAAATGRPELLETARTLVALVGHLLLARHPLYAIAPWIAQRVPEHFGLHPDEVSLCNDDRLGRAVEHLFGADCASLFTALILHVVRAFSVDISQIHNDSTTITLSGEYAGQADPEKKDRAPLIAKGYNKDHRPDLKQLLYCLTVSADGAVPVHFKIYDGNTTDDQTHRHTWLRVAEVVGNSDFLYVADSKLCSHDNLAFIGGKNGRFLTVMPRTWKEWSLLQKYVQEQPESLWCEISKEPAKRGRAKAPNIYWGFEYPKKTEGGYRLLCYRSSRKMKDDALARQRKLQRFRQWNQTHSAKPKRFDSVAKAEEYGKRQVQEKKVTPWVRCWVQERRQTHKKQVGRGRPGPQTPYETREEIWYEAAFAEDQEAIEADAKWDGMFSLITNDVSLKLKEVLEKYKYQPFLEKRFEQMKTVFGVMPVWLKKPERISGLLFVYFVVLLVQALLEREVRLKMKEQKIEELPLYPEGRMTKRPTAELILSAFEGLRRHRLMDERGCALRTFHDPLSPVARQILQLLGVDSSPFGFP